MVQAGRDHRREGPISPDKRTIHVRSNAVGRGDGAKGDSERKQCVLNSILPGFFSEKEPNSVE